MTQDVGRRKMAVAALSVLSNTALVVLKLIVGLMIGSVSIISEAIHSGVDLLAAIIAFAAVRVSGRQPDEEHPFGHGKWENISGTVEALLIFLAAGWIIYEAIHKLVKPVELAAVDWGVVVMLISVLANTIISTKLFRVGRETDSIALQADAWHLRTDVYTSLGVMIGLAAIWVGKRLGPGLDLQWVDPLAAIVVALLIVRAAWHLTAESVRGLLDTRLSREDEGWIRTYLQGVHDDVRGFHHLRTRKSGASRFIEMHLMVPATMSVDEAHGINDLVTAGIREHFPDSRVMIHIEPCDGDCSPSCRAGCRQPQYAGKNAE